MGGGGGGGGGSFVSSLMTQLPRMTKAQDALHSAHPTVRAHILEQASIRVQASIQVSIAQQQRVAQLAALLFAAALVGAQVATQPDLPRLRVTLTILSVALFAIGGISCVFGLLSRQIQLPGYRPSWWISMSASEEEPIEVARSWQAANLEEVLVSIEETAKRRSILLFAAVVFGTLATLSMIIGMIVTIRN